MTIILTILIFEVLAVVGYYEDHICIRSDKLCPFKVGIAKKSLGAPCNWHRNIEVIMLTDGEGKMQYGKELFKLSVGDIVIVNSGALHHLYSDTGMSFYYIIIDEGFSRENGVDTAELCFDERVFSETVRELILAVVAASREYLESSAPIDAARLRSAVLSLLIEIAAKHATPGEPHGEAIAPQEEYIKTVLDYLHRDVLQTISLDSLAALCGITKFYLCREFKRLVGQTVFTYANTLKCKRAESLIASGKSVTEAAFECGFESLSYFSRTYKRLIGTPPSRAARAGSRDE